jgi:hypothetical protein
MQRVNRDGDEAGLTTLIRVDERPAQELLWSMQDAQMVAFPPTPGLAMAPRFELGLAEAFGLASADSLVTGWTAGELHRLIGSAAERVAIRARDIDGVEHTLLLDMTGYHALAGRFPPYCRPPE